MEEVYSTILPRQRDLFLKKADAAAYDDGRLLPSAEGVDECNPEDMVVDAEDPYSRQQEEQLEAMLDAWVANIRQRIIVIEGNFSGGSAGIEVEAVPCKYREMVAERFLRWKYSVQEEEQQQQKQQPPRSFHILVQFCTALATSSACLGILRRHREGQGEMKNPKLPEDLNFVLDCLSYLLLEDQDATMYQELNSISLTTSSSVSSSLSFWIQTMAVAIPRHVTDSITTRMLPNATTSQKIQMFTSSRAYITQILRHSLLYPNVCSRFLSHWLSRGGGRKVDDVVYALYHIHCASTSTTTKKMPSVVVSLSSMRAREIGILFRAVLQFSMEDPKNTNNRRDDENDGPTMEIFVDEIFDGNSKNNDATPSILASHWETITRQIVLSSSSVTITRNNTLTKKSSLSNTNKGEKVVDPRLCQTYVQALSRCNSSSISSDGNDDPVDDLVHHSDESESDSEHEDSPVSRRSFPHFQQWLWKSLNMVVGDWSTPWFVERTDPYLQNHVSVFIVYALNKIVETSNDKNNFYRSVLETSGISINILQGVTHRLQSTCSTESRLDGMRVAEALAKALGQELQFDELHDEQVPPHNVTKRQNYNDPDKEDKTDDHPKADDDSDWDENSALERYDVEDDEEDLRQIPRPFYLSECLDYLRANNENDVDCYSRHATVLQELPDLVRSRPADLADQAPELARSLLRLENKSGMKDFMEQVTHSISVLLVEEPLGVGSNMIEEFFVESTLLDRLTILNAVNTAAFELSGDKALLEKQEKQAELFYLEVGPRVSGRKAFVSETAVSSKNSTRRWGLGRRRSQQEKSVIHNRFQNIAPIWFYHFFSKFMDTKDDAAIWGGPNGARLLSSVFVTLTNIVECTGCYAPGVDVMAKDFLDFTWSFRDAEVSIVRSSVLYSVKGTLGLLREETLWRFLLNDSSDSLVRHLQIIQDQDPDSNCRHLAKAIAQTVANIVNEIGRLDPLLIEAR